MAEMMTARYGHAMTTNGASIFVIGGDEPTYKTAEVYNPQTNRWRQVQSLPHSRLYTGAVYLWGNIILPAGSGAGGGKQNTIYVYNISADTWTLSNVKLNYAVDYCSIAAITNT